jgi:hypothetical protein
MGDDDGLAAAWDEFCDTLRAAGSSVLGQKAPSSEATRADGFAHLAQLLTLGLDFFVLNADADFPEFTRVITPTRKWALDNPDSQYDRAPVRSDNTYRISGNAGSAALMLFDINTGMLGSQTKARRQAAHLTSRDIDIEPDGTFEVIVGGEARRRNWLELEEGLSPSDFGLVLRQYFADRSTEKPATYSIERVGPALVRGPRSAADVQSGLRQSAAFARDMIEYWARVGSDFEATPNQLISQRGSRVDGTGANPDNAYWWGLWRLAPDQALVIECDPMPGAEFWNFYASNIWWEDLDERSHRMTVNSSNARPEDDGTLKLVLAERDPGFGNWLQTTGFTEGIMLMRTTFPTASFSVRSEIIDLES